MKLFFYFLLFFMFLSCKPKSSNEMDTVIATEETIELLELQAFEIYQESPKEAIQLFKQVVDYYGANPNPKKVGITNLNIANIYDERLGKPDSALVYSQKALDNWYKENDTLQMANLYKYVGLLKGRLGNNQDAENDIRKAIKLYKEAGFERGVAVSEINLAEVYFRTEKYMESEALFLKSTKYWNSVDDQSRVFTNNMLGMRIYSATGDEKHISLLIKENKEIQGQVELNEFVQNTFSELLDELNSSK